MYTKDFKMSPIYEDLIQQMTKPEHGAQMPQGLNPELLYLVNWNQGQVWIAMGLSKMIEKGVTVAKAYISDNLKELAGVA
jgi:hypothetical protein